MVQANELRIGNVFVRELPTARGLEYEHEFILTEEWIGKLFTDNISIALQDLFPIPLTPEILEKCGFEGNNHKRRFKKVIESSLTMYFQDGIFSLEDYDWFAQNLDHIKYLHQLQNLYWCLCGQELEIKL